MTSSFQRTLVSLLRSPYLAGFAIIGLLAVLLLPPDRYLIDFDVYRTGAQVLLAGGDLYGPLPQLANGEYLPFTYPPVAAVLFAGFPLLPLPVGSALFTLVSAGCLVLVIRKVLEVVGKQPSYRAVVGLIVLSLLLTPVRDNFGYGQINLMLLFLVVFGALGFQRRYRWLGGVLVGLAIAIKLTPAVFLAFFLLRRDWRNLASTLASALLFTGLGFLVAPSDSLRYWSSVLWDPSRIGGLSYTSNQSLNGILYRFGLTGGTVKLTWFVLGSLIGLGIMFVSYRLLQQRRELAALCCVCFIALLCSPVSWGHHWVWAVPTLILLWSELKAGLDRKVLLFGGIAIMLIGPQWFLPQGNNIELTWQPWQHLIGNSYIIWAVAVIVVLGLSTRAKAAPVT